jgi:hypothetical protein
MRGVTDALRKAMPAKRLPRQDGVPRHRRDKATLLLDCRPCRSRPDLTEEGCLLCAVHALAGQSGVSRLLLCGEIDACYEGASVSVLKDLAGVRALCQMSMSRVTGGKGCSQCSLRPSIVFETTTSLPQLQWAKGQLDRLNRLRPSSLSCRLCIDQTVAALEEIESRSRGIERTIAKHSLRVVGDSSHA